MQILVHLAGRSVINLDDMNLKVYVGVIESGAGYLKM